MYVKTSEGGMTKSARLEVRMTDALFQAVKKAARKRNRDVSTFAREALCSACGLNVTLAGLARGRPWPKSKGPRL
jgi:predicted transcriptional regulator